MKFQKPDLAFHPGISIISQSRDRGISLPWTQAALLHLLLVLGVLWIGLTVNTAMVNTLLIFVFLTGSGLWLCHRTKEILADPNLKILGTFWLVKVGMTLFLLYAGWIPYLDPATSPAWGYDPQRYFQNAMELIKNGWKPAVSQNYQGILYYYAGIFYLFGYNPVIPALINAYVTLLGTLFLIRCAYSFAPERTTKDWLLVGLLLIPEVLWYDVMTSRETLMAVLIIVATLSVGRYLVGVGKTRLTITLLLCGITLLAILAVRTSMAIPVVVNIAIMAYMLRSRRQMGPVFKVLLIVLGLGAILVGPFIQQVTGGYDIDYLEKLESVRSFEPSEGQEWSDRSIGLYLAPNNAWQALLYLPPRMVLYLATPLPNVTVSIAELLDGSWSAWQRLMTLPTSIMMLLGFHYVLAATVQAWRYRLRSPASLVLPVTFWCTFIAVAGGNIIIHERYRLMLTLILFTCMWWGYTRCSRREVKLCAMVWFGLLACGALFYMGYKFI
ncbi:MAG: hypothetical protein ACWGKN_12220 [Desulfoprunum sp.]